MSYPPFSHSPSSRALEVPPFFPPPIPIQIHSASSADEADTTFARLRYAIAAGASESDSLLDAITEAARSLTDASGAALALRRNGVVICRARSGETAPELGARLAEDSGISGECLRTGQTLRCDDTQRDYRVDPVVCRALGLRSIAIIPLREKQETIGILEVFSTRAYGFNETHMTYLNHLAELAEAAQAAVQEKAQDKTQDQDKDKGRAKVQAKAQNRPATIEITPVPEAKPAVQSVAQPILRQEPAHNVLANDADAPRLLERLYEGRVRGRLYEPAKPPYRIIALAVAAFVLASFVSWRVLSKPALPAASSVTSSQAAVPETAPETEELVIARPSPSHPLTSSRTSPVRKHDRVAEEDDTPEVVTRVENPAVLKPAKQSTPDAIPSESRATADPKSTQNPDPAPIQTVDEQQPPQQPKIVQSATETAALGNLFPSPAALPKLTAPVSDGVKMGGLERKVQPVYPQRALTMGLEGPVVMEVAVAEDGKVGKVKVVSGNPILAQAASEAVAQWRYRPSTLNGKPVPMQTQITINFKKP